MRRYLFLLLIVFIATTGPACAEVLSIRQQVVAPSGTGHTEVTALSAENEAEREKIVNYLIETLQADRVTNPDLLAAFELVTSGSGRGPSSVDSPAQTSIKKIAGSGTVHHRKLSPEMRAALVSRFKSWFEKNYRITFSLARGFTNGSVTTWSLMVSHEIPFPIALAAGTITGAMSGGFQYWNDFFRIYLTKNISVRFVPHELLRTGMKRIEPFFRWYLLEVGFIGVVQITMQALGHGPEGTFAQIAGANLTMAALSLGAQGSWDVAVSKVVRAKLARAITETGRKRIRLRGDLITLALSALSVSAVVGKLQHFEISNYVFGTMGATGLIYLVKIWYDEWKCKSNLMKVPPPRQDEESTIEISSFYLSTPFYYS